MVVRMMDVNSLAPSYPEFVEVDPTGRYGRYNEILGKGSSKTVYRGFDEYEGIEVAWNQVKLNDFLQSPEDLERLYCEIHLLKTLKHKNIMKFYTSWVDISNRNINFVTEMFTSGTLRQYRQKHKRVSVRAVKHWCRQILEGLLYLHSHEPPIIHRDLKCDNIFINGNQGEVKIGDLGLAAILRKSHAVHCVGTPEFMAPEVYEEEYNELVDIYSFGMCVLEMVTFEYPYSECTHPAQIYKKVISGTKPEALSRVKDPEVRQFIEKCLVSASRRLSARELLNDPFLQVEGLASGYLDGDIGVIGPICMQPSLNHIKCNDPLLDDCFASEYNCDVVLDDGWDYEVDDVETDGIDLFNSPEDEAFGNVDITIKGRRKEDGGIFLRLRIADKEGKVRNIYFPFDVEADTALTVAMEMVAELDITDHDVTRIAEMIDGEVSALVPDWKPGPGIEEMPGFPSSNLCHNCASNVSSCGSLLEYHCYKTSGSSNHCSRVECAATHGRFEEITYQVEGSDPCVINAENVHSSRQSDSLPSCSQASSGSHSDENDEQMDQSSKDDRLLHVNGHTHSSSMRFDAQFSLDRHKHLDADELGHHSPVNDEYDDNENEICQELRWLKTKYQVELMEYSNQQFGESRKVLHPSSDFNKKTDQLKSFHFGTHFSFHIPQVDTNSTLRHKSSPNLNIGYCRISNCSLVNAQSSPEIMFTAKNFYSGAHLPCSLSRTKSLPVDAVDV